MCFRSRLKLLFLLFIFMKRVTQIPSLLTEFVDIAAQ